MIRRSPGDDLKLHPSISDSGQIGQCIYLEETMDSIGIEATSRSSGDVHGLSLPTVLGMLCLVILLGIISSRGLRSRGLAVHHLFLKINLKRENKEFTGFVRTLDVDKMRVVMAEAPIRGETLNLELSSLPGFPEEGKFVQGHVTKVKAIGGNNHNFIVTISFDAATSDSRLEESLVSYLRNLHA
jgi:hypothetical protein